MFGKQSWRRSDQLPARIIRVSCDVNCLLHLPTICQSKSVQQGGSSSFHRVSPRGRGRRTKLCAVFHVVITSKHRTLHQQ